MINALKTALLLGMLTSILLLIGFVWAGVWGMGIFLLIAFLINFFSYWYSDRIVLGMYGAKPLSERENPKLHSMLAKLAKNAGIPKPRLYLIPLPTPNAFATGRNPKNSAVAVTQSLLQLEEEEIEGVLAHELSHVKARDTLTATIAATIGGAIAYLAYLGWWSLSARREGFILLPLLLLAPLAAVLIRLAISRAREYEADRKAALLTRKPLALASALQKIVAYVKKKPLLGNSSTSHLFIVNPFSTDFLTKIFSTHPPVEARVRELEKIAKQLQG